MVNTVSQCVYRFKVANACLAIALVEKAEEAYFALSIEDSKDYEKVKSAMLRTYELIPEAYCQRFRGLSKLDEQTYVELAKEKETSFSSCCKSQKEETNGAFHQQVRFIQHTSAQ